MDFLTVWIFEELLKIVIQRTENDDTPVLYYEGPNNGNLFSDIKSDIFSLFWLQLGQMLMDFLTVLIFEQLLKIVIQRANERTRICFVTVGKACFVAVARM